MGLSLYYYYDLRTGFLRIRKVQLRSKNVILCCTCEFTEKRCTLPLETFQIIFNEINIETTAVTNNATVNQKIRLEKIC